jgi:hypothetical protein
MSARLCLFSLVAVLLVVAPNASAQWYEDFDSYVAGSGLIGQGGWEGWDGSAAYDGFVSDAYAYSAPNSAQIIDASDLIHQFTGYTSGVWIFTSYVYVPMDFQGQSYYILLNTYSHGGTNNWSVQVMFDSAGVVDSYPESSQLPLIQGEWVELRLEIDLDADLQTFYYGGDMLYQKSWIDGASGGGVPNIACLDLFGNGATPVYYDSFSLEEDEPTPADDTTWGAIKSLYR